MRKTGRNDKCPCGSGRKFKHCCLNRKKDGDSYFIDTASHLHIRCGIENLLEDTTINFGRIYEEYCFLPGSDAAAPCSTFFNGLLRHVEEIIVDLCARFSSYELFFWYRRIRPINKYSNASAYNYHELIKRCIYMFGNRADVFSITESSFIPTLVPKYIASIDTADLNGGSIPTQVIAVLSALYKLEDLCHYYIYICNSFRIFSKGGCVQRHDTYGFAVEPGNPEIAYLIHLYDERSKSQSLLTTIGTTSVDSNYNNSHFTLMILQYNFEDVSQLLHSNVHFTSQADTCNFFFGAVNLQDYYTFMLKFNPVLYQKLGFYIEDLLSILFYCSNDLASAIMPLFAEDEPGMEALGRSFQIMQRAYTVIEDSEENRRVLIQCFLDTHSKVFPNLPKPAVPNLLKAFDYLFFRHANYTTLESELLKGYFFNKITKDKIVVDYTAFIPVLRSVLSPIQSIDGAFGNIASEDLERKVNEKIIALFGELAVYAKGEIHNSQGKTKEIDASFVHHGCLFIFECKSLSVSTGSLLGSENAVKFRKNKLIAYLHEVEEKAEFLLSNKDSLTKRLPVDARYIVPIIITSFPEYVWEKSDSLFISEDLPRIMTLDDIGKLKNPKIYASLEKKAYVRKISHEI